MYAGRVIELGSTARVFGFPVHPYSQGLLAAVPSPERAEALMGIEGQPPRPGRRPPGCSFAPRCSFVTEPCRSVNPEPEIVSGRLVRCIRAAEITDRERLRPLLLDRRTSSEVPPAPVLSLKGVSARYGSTPVLFDVDIDLRPEMCLAVVGESGSGKTTLARCIVGLHENWTGEMTFEGARLTQGARRRPKAILRSIQYVFQNPYTSLNPRKTIGQIVSQPLEHFFDLSFAERAAACGEILEDVSLGEDFVRRYPDQLSGGERQRVAIATGPRRRARPARLRRGDLRPRRLRAGDHRRAAPATAERAPAVDDLHHPQPRSRPQHRPGRRRAVHRPRRSRRDRSRRSSSDRRSSTRSASWRTCPSSPSPAPPSPSRPELDLLLSQKPNLSTSQSDRTPQRRRQRTATSARSAGTRSW